MKTPLDRLTLGQKIQLGIALVATSLLGAMMFRACHETRSVSLIDPAPAPIAARTDDKPGPAIAVAHTRFVELPEQGFDVRLVLSQSKATVDRLLGHHEQLEDGPWSYDRFDKVGVNVMFDNDRAAVVSIVANGLHDDPAAIDEVLMWLRGDRTDFVVEWRGMLDVWEPAMHERQMKRRATAREITETLHEQGATSSEAAANGTDLEINAPPGICNRRALSALIAPIKGDLKRLGFAMAECSGEEGTTIVLR